MKYFSNKYFQGLLIIAIVISGRCLGQDHLPHVNELFFEEVSIVTDRDVYCVNEFIRFKAVNGSSDQLRDAKWSNVLYVEIVSHNGTALVQKKFNYSNDGANGILHIPSAVLTGNYYLRAYTRWMRNYGAHNFFHKAITIVNPFDDSLEKNYDEGGLPGNFGKFPETKEVVINTSKLKYGKREKVDISLISENAFSSCVISVIKDGLYRPRYYNATIKKELPDQRQYIPETRSLSVSGKVISVEDSAEVPYNRVYLSILKDMPEIRTTLSAEDGSFYFDLPKLRGEYELLLSCGKGLQNENAILLVDNDFSPEKVSLPYVPFTLFEENRSLLEELSVNSQVQSLYKNESQQFIGEDWTRTEKFYGEPDQSVVLDNYVELPSMEDYFRELVSLVSIRRNQGQKQFRVLGEDPDLRNNEPLLMLDMVAINDVNEILNMPPSELASIEIINQPYVLGSYTYGGIISLITKEGNLGGINLSASSRYIDYKMLNNIALDLSMLPYPERIPDKRNNLYWNGSLSLESNQNLSLSFFTGDTTGEFLIVFTGINKSGNMLTSIKSIVVEN